VFDRQQGTNIPQQTRGRYFLTALHSHDRTVLHCIVFYPKFIMMRHDVEKAMEFPHGQAIIEKRYGISM
jgi:hypothetical protein